MSKGFAFVLPIGLTLGGSNIWSVQMAEKLSARGRPVTLFEHSVVDWHPPLDVQLPEAVKVCSVGGARPSQAGRSDLRRYVSAYVEALPAVFVPNFGCGAYAACAQLTRNHADGVRVVGVGHGHSDAYMDVLAHYEPIIHSFVAVNQRMATEMASLMPHREADIAVRACPVNVPASLDHRVTGDDGPLRLAYAGRITNHEKRCSLITPLVQALVERGVDFELHIVGEGPYMPTLAHEVAGLPETLRDSICFRGMLAPGDMSELWASMHVTFLVSDTESTGLSLLEGMAQGCVPVSTNCGGPSDYIRSGENGFMVALEDVSAMADVIVRLAEDRQLLSEMGRKARETTSQFYSYEQYMKWFLALSDDLWAQESRVWPEDRPLLPKGLTRSRGSWMQAMLRRLKGD